MIKFMQADESNSVTNINIAPDGTSPYAKVINWMARSADGYILLFTDAADEAAVERYFSNINTSAKDPKSLVLNEKDMKVRVLSRAEFLSAGGKFVHKDALLIPTRVTIQTYRVIDGDVIIYRTAPEDGSAVIPILVTYTVTMRKSMMFLGERKATISFSNQGCAEGALFYKVTNSNFKYPITSEMMRKSFTVKVGQNEINVFAGEKYRQYYIVKQTRI